MRHRNSRQPIPLEGKLGATVPLSVPLAYAGPQDGCRGHPVSIVVDVAVDLPTKRDQNRRESSAFVVACGAIARLLRARAELAQTTTR